MVFNFQIKNDVNINRLKELLVNMLNEMNLNSKVYVNLREEYKDEINNNLLNILLYSSNKNSEEIDVFKDMLHIHKCENNDLHFTYKGYMFLHMKSNDLKDAYLVALVIEIIELIERSGYSTNEKAIYHSIYNFI